ncbi:chemotaxis protein CheW [Rhodocytophaga aerolata]|uniref:Chemotaxis protein CheW n=1 Tax=Rhodocytophaga aerolata TaxID=455078 RepID=A0ABT8RGM8_9BACT|nr:chemotaxis protein CheW [Rhodocytophaga aerolata]MDO1451265.1 chemotaxis protein CheW [Rhodocytophaga aerolata]
MESVTENKILPVNSEKKQKSFQIIVFKLGSEEYALSIEQIKEVVSTPNIARIPLTQSYIKGVGNIRGNVLAIIDLAERFGIASEAEINHGTHKYTLVVASEEYKIGILVKEVPNTLRVTDADIDTSPHMIQDSSLGNNYIRGIVKSGNRMIILMDVFKIITKEDKEFILKAD